MALELLHGRADGVWMHPPFHDQNIGIHRLGDGEEGIRSCDRPHRDDNASDNQQKLRPPGKRPAIFAHQQASQCAILLS
jgi:hypothetical protein